MNSVASSISGFSKMKAGKSVGASKKYFQGVAYFLPKSVKSKFCWNLPLFSY
jgi:hypothetical protein